LLALSAAVFSLAVLAGPPLPADWQQLAIELKAPGADIEPEPPDQPPLDAFFTALEATEPHPVRVVVLGNSLIASDGVVGIIRQRLTERFGDAGRGLLLADRLGPWGPRVRTGMARGQWGLSTVGMLAPLTEVHGLSGAQHQALSSGASTEYELSGETHAEFHWFVPKDRDHPGLRVEVDGRRFSSFYPLRTGRVLHTEVTLPATASLLRLVFDEPGPVVQAVVLEKPERGVVVDTLGVPSVDASLYLRTDETLFIEQLRQRAPSLVVVMLGGNEVKRMAWGKAELPTIEKDLHAFIRRAQQAAPNASCLVVSPIDSVRGKGAPVPFEQRPQLAPFLEVQRRVAKEEHCAYFDLFNAMGGSGALKRFWSRGLVHADLVHPRSDGLDLLGELISAALLRAWDSRQLEKTAQRPNAR
jgi:lysophospholipase L1-like esterase